MAFCQQLRGKCDRGKKKLAATDVGLVAQWSSDLGDLTLLERLDFHCPPQSLVLCPMCRNSLNQLPSGRRYVWIPSVMDHDHVETWTLKSGRMVMHVGGRTE